MSPIALQIDGQTYRVASLLKRVTISTSIEAQTHRLAPLLIKR